MSNFSTSHDFIPYVSGKAAALSGQRLAVAKYKSSKDKATSAVIAAKFASIAVSIPRLSVTLDSIKDTYLPAIRRMLEAAQDGIIKDLHEAGSKAVTSGELNPDACIAYLEAVEAGSKLTEADVANWFADSVETVLSVAFAEKLGISDTPSDSESKKLEAAVGGYKEKFVALAGGKKRYDVATAKKLENVIKLADAGEITAKFMARLKDMQKVEADTLADLL